jgi:hypothetical protein
VKNTSLAMGLAFVLMMGGLFQVPAYSPQQDDPSIKATTVFGNVSEINASAGQITIKTAAGSVVVANVNEKTTYQRMPLIASRFRLNKSSSSASRTSPSGLPRNVRRGRGARKAS